MHHLHTIFQIHSVLTNTVKPDKGKTWVHVNKRNTFHHYDTLGFLNLCKIILVHPLQDIFPDPIKTWQGHSIRKISYSHLPCIPSVVQFSNSGMHIKLFHGNAARVWVKPWCPRFKKLGPQEMHKLPTTHVHHLKHWDWTSFFSVKFSYEQTWQQGLERKKHNAIK